tara:strand:- start:87 stop:212 length:126 start_codon:yes stop_codon:yes gene_type:complete
VIKEKGSVDSRKGMPVIGNLRMKLKGNFRPAEVDKEKQRLG